MLERLRDYADQQLELPPSMYQRQPIRYIIDLDREGKFLGITDTADPARKNTRRGVPRLGPHLVRTSGVRAKLLVDKASYLLGYVPLGTEPGRQVQEHEAFVELVRACAEETGEPTVHAALVFLSSDELRALPLPVGFDPTHQLTVRVDGFFPIDLSTVRQFWAARAEVGEEMQCISCGQIAPALDVHPIPIKPIPGGQTSGNFLVSANAKAFESYGLEGSLIAPTCRPCGERYGNALNALLAGEDTRLWVGGMVYVFWTRGTAAFRPGHTLSAPDSAEVRELIDAARSGKSAATEINATAFYALGLSGSGARVVVRDWIDTTVPEAKRRLGHYFALQNLVDYDGAPGTPLSIRTLANATVRDPKTEQPPADVPRALLGLALGGRPLAREVLFHAVRRCRAQQGVRRPQAMLVKLVLGSRPDLRPEIGGRAVTDHLDQNNTTPAYLCGRLLAVLDAIQRRALNNPNATVVDRFYGSASSAPASVFGTLLHGTRPHLSKLRRDPRSQAAAFALEQRLEDVMRPLPTFPPTLTLPEQGLFALGFYHQRADDRRAAREHAALRGIAAPTIPEESVDET